MFKVLLATALLVNVVVLRRHGKRDGEGRKGDRPGDGFKRPQGPEGFVELTGSGVLTSTTG
ncbi:hypothetical protein [Rhizobium mayense]|uniref:Uncharacterized protein n=1 Tax=Rhizobium mayense TaxID=1312184 RepID=A0ABT7K222_9HYPH|nr:hypothetical protein [Rhizobium mayense]MDL2402658.1 hypothetical protein [Rhizobium mayense]